MPTPAEGIQAQLRNIEATYGRSIDDLVAEVAASGMTKHTEVVTMLKQRHGMAHGAAHRVSLVARERLHADSGNEDTELIAPALRPVHAELMRLISALGPEVEQAPKKGYLSLRRRKQFAMLQPGAKVVNLGLVLPGYEPKGRLEAAGTWNALFTHRVRIASVDEIDAEVREWLRAAFASAS